LPRICFIINTLAFFNSHRLPLALEAVKTGYDVHIITNLDSEEAEHFSEFTYHHVGFTRSGQNPFVELSSLLRIFLLLKKIKPSLVHLVTIKPVLYGGIAARLAGIEAIVAAISGLGSVFSAKEGFGLIRLRVVRYLYQIALNHKKLAVIFQNSDDREKLLLTEAVHSQNTFMIRGSGVSLSDYPCTPESSQLPIVSMAARLLKEKGVCEFVDAARILKSRGISVQMQVIGSPDLGNPFSVTEKDISDWHDENIVHFLGFRKDISSLYSQSNIVCLPSYYGEGLPKSLIEAAACGRAVITTDMPGCRDAITPNVTGLLIPPRDAVALADAIQILIENPAKRHAMAKAGRELAEEAFTIENVIRQHFRIYEELLSNVNVAL
jgi:glycosyltransferase involved in cell wall biosynthesis